MVPIFVLLFTNPLAAQLFSHTVTTFRKVAFSYTDFTHSMQVFTHCVNDIQNFLASNKLYLNPEQEAFIVSPDESQGYLGFSTVTPPLQRFPFGRDNLKNILDLSNLVCGYIRAMPRTLLFCDLDLQFQGHWWPLKGQILAIFSHFGPVLIYRKLHHPMAGIQNTYICPL